MDGVGSGGYVGFVLRVVGELLIKDFKFGSVVMDLMFLIDVFVRGVENG